MAKRAHVLYAIALICFLADSGFAIGAAAGKGSQNGRGGAHLLGSKGGSNNNAQWAADPVRGWVRADERKKTQERSASSNGRKQNDKRTGKDKSKKS